MPHLTIDGRPIEVPEGTTLLQAAERLGIDVPTLCHLQGFEPSTSCLVCMVKIRGQNRLVPSCGTRAVEGMEIESETPEVHQVRRVALELLLSDHVGDCLAPCHFACPAHMNVPLMLRQINADALREAIVTIKQDIALPAVLGRVCIKPCEKGCRRGGADGAVAVCELKRYVADRDLGSDDPYLPPCAADSGKRVAVVGAGPTGLSAAYYLRQDGHAVTLFDEHPQPGGRLRYQMQESELPHDVLDAEIAQILRLGIPWRPNTRIGQSPSLAELAQQFDAVLIACGNLSKDVVQALGLAPAAHGVQVHKETFQTDRPGVFAAGGAIRAKGLVVRSVADGKEAAHSISRFLGYVRPAAPQADFSVRIGKLAPDEIAEFVAGAAPTPRQEPNLPAGGYTPAEATEQAGRCLHCDCRKLSSCKLRRYAAQYGADPGRYRGQRAVFRQHLQHSVVIYEPGKCIDCGLCIQIARDAGEPLGLTFIGRGFDVRVGIPFSRPLEQALSMVAAQCVAACPTSALALREESAGQLPILGQP